MGLLNYGGSLCRQSLCFAPGTICSDYSPLVLKAVNRPQMLYPKLFNPTLKEGALFLSLVQQQHNVSGPNQRPPELLPRRCLDYTVRDPISLIDLRLL